MDYSLTPHLAVTSPRAGLGWLTQLERGGTLARSRVIPRSLLSLGAPN